MFLATIFNFSYSAYSIVKNTRGIPENTEKGLQAIPEDSWPLHGVRGLQVSQLFPVVVAQDPHLFVSVNLVDK